MGIALDQGRGGLFAAVGVKGITKDGEVGAQLIGHRAGAFGGWAVHRAAPGPEAAGDRGVRRSSAGDRCGGQGHVADTQFTSAPASCFEAPSRVAGSGLLPVAFCPGSQARPDAWPMNAS